MNLEDVSLWQEEKNSRWFSNKRIKCDLCGKRSDRILDIIDEKDNQRTFACIMPDRPCAHRAITLIFGGHLTKHNDDYLWARLIEYKPLSCLQKGQREAVGLSKRYEVLKRDGFQCCFCGATGKEAKLEVDHIIPRSKGGSNHKGNLQTLCFSCNRGKRDH